MSAAHPCVLTLNAGSSSLKFAAFEGAPPRRALSGQVGGIGPQARLIVGGEARDLGPTDHAAATRLAIGIAGEGGRPDAIGHRVVHGGPSGDGPTMIDDARLDELEGLAALAPLHQPHNLAAIRAAREAFPEGVQVACFDTAFHRAQPWVADTYALPRRHYEAGVRRYGFHGLSYEAIAARLRADHPGLHAGRVIVAHLGHGASICAIEGGRAMGSSMGFSPLDGLPMGTRCGQIDPGAILHLMRAEGLDADAMEALLYRESGLLGLSGGLSDMRALLASDAPEAGQAVDYFVARLRREIGAMAATLGGLDALVFTGGIGENAGPIRARAVEGLGFLGLAIDAAANEAGAERIHAGPVPILRLPTDEEGVIARAALAVLEGRAA